MPNIDRLPGTIRSVKNNPDEFDHPDLTPADIARESGHFHLADILAPVIQHTVPHQTLARLQSLFHEMIRADWGIQMAHLVLPDLVALTELRVPEMWFPVGEQHETRNVVRITRYCSVMDRLLIRCARAISTKLMAESSW